MSGPADSADIGRQASSALVWSLANTAVGKLGTLAIGIVLARLLGPESYGTFAVATVALLVVLSFNELGVSLAIVRWTGDPAEIAPTVATISVVSSTVLTLGGYWVAPTFASAMGDPEATSVVRLMLVAVLLNGFAATPAALMQRQFQQRRRFAIDQTNVWVGAAVSVALALLGFGAMSLAIGRIAGSVLSTVMFIALSPAPLRFGFRRARARELLRFGMPLAGSSVVVMAVTQVDQIVVGAAFGPTQLGFYVLAANLASWPVALLSQPLRNVAPAVFARLQHDPSAGSDALRRTVRLLASAAAPLCVALAVMAPEIVQVVYGSQWSGAGVILRWLALLALLRIFFELAYDFLVVQKRTGRILVIQTLWLCALVPGLVLAARWTDPAGVAIAQIVIAVVVVVPLYAFALRRVGPLLSGLTRGLALPVVGAVFTWGCGAFAAASISSPLWSCLVAGLLAAIVIAGLVWFSRADAQFLRRLETIAPDGTEDVRGS